MTWGACHRQLSDVYPRTAFDIYSALQVKARTSIVKTLHRRYIIQIIFSSRIMRMYLPASAKKTSLRPVRRVRLTHKTHRKSIANEDATSI